MGKGASMKAAALRRCETAKKGGCWISGPLSVRLNLFTLGNGSYGNPMSLLL